MIKEGEWTDGESFVALAQGAAVLGVGLLGRKSTQSHQRTEYSALLLNMAYGEPATLGMILWPSDLSTQVQY